MIAIGTERATAVAERSRRIAGRRLGDRVATGVAPRDRARYAKLPGMIALVRRSCAFLRRFATRLRRRGGGYVAARSALLPLIREGDPTRTLIDATRPVHSRSRVRIAARNVAVSLAWLTRRDVRPVPASTGSALQGIEAVSDDRDGRAGRRRCSSATRRSSASRSTASSGPRRRCSAAARPPTRARRRTPTSARSASACRARCPVINRRAVELVIATGLAIEAADPGADPVGAQELLLPGPAQGLPDQPVRDPARVAPAGSRSRPRTARSRCTITRAHLEEDTAKLVHGDAGRHAAAGGRRLVDFNRSGAPLMEIVTEPEIRTAEQARRYAEELQLLLRAIGASDADMERGQMRVEANVSLRPRGAEAFGTRVEVKNMNSFRSVERAIAFEIERQGAALDAGETLVDGDARLGRRRGRRPTGCGPRRRPTTTATSRSPDLPPLHVEPAGSTAIRADAAGAAGGPAGALRGASGSPPTTPR